MGGGNIQHYEMRMDGLTSSLTSVQKDNYVLTINNMETKQEYKHPTKEQLIAYFGDRIRVRKMTPREAFRLMDVSEEDIDKIQGYPYKEVQERRKAHATLTQKELAKDYIGKGSIPKTAQYRLAGNSIVVNVLYHIFRTLFIPNQPENQKQNQPPMQLSMFD